MSSDPGKRWDLARLELFAHVAHVGSLTKAAVARSSAQPAISRQIAALERECGGRLFYRTGRGVALTQLGERMLRRVNAILEQTELLSQEIGDSAGVTSGEVRIGTLPSLYKSLVWPLFLGVSERYPSIRLRIFEGSGGQIDEWLSNGYVDIGLPYRYGRRLPRDVERLIAADSYLIGHRAERLTAATSIDFDLLDGRPLVLPGAPSNMRVSLDQIAKRKRIKLNVVLEADSLQIQKEFVFEQHGFTVLPRHAVLGELQAGTLQAARIINPVVGRTVVLATSTARPVSLAAREVAKLVRELCATAF